MMKKNKLEYDEKWFEYGFIDEVVLMNQLTEFAKGEDLNTEHYRYQSFLNFIANKESFTEGNIRNFIDLVEIDNDKLMSSNALAKLFLSKKLTAIQTQMVSKKLITFGNWAEKLVKKN